MLDDALKSFGDAFAAGAENTGAVVYGPAQQINPPFPIGAVLTEYYSKLALREQPQVGGQLLLSLFMLEELESAQSGWRWVSRNGAPAMDDPSWDKNRIVIADRHGDALAVDQASAAGTVSGHIGPLAFTVANDLASFLQTMAEAMTVEATTFAYEVLDDDCNPDPRFLDEVSAIALRLLGPDGEAGFMKFFFG